MNSKITSLSKKLAVAGLILTTLPGCTLVDSIMSLVGGKKDKAAAASQVSEVGSGPVLVSIDGKAAVTDGDLTEHLKKMVAAYPQMSGLDPASFPAPMKMMILQQLADRELILAHALEQGIDKDKTYQKDLGEAIKEIKRLLLVQHFEKSILDGIEVTDKDVRDDYDTNKERYLKAPGGNLVTGVSFATLEDAQAFLMSAPSEPTRFTKDARTAKDGTFAEFGRVTAMTPGVAPAIKKAVSEAHSFPKTSLVEDGTKFWVLMIHDPKDTEYYDFDEIKGQIEQMLKSKKYQDVRGEKLDEIKGHHTLEIHEDRLAPQEDDSSGLLDMQVAG